MFRDIFLNYIYRGDGPIQINVSLVGSGNVSLFLFCQLCLLTTNDKRQTTNIANISYLPTKFSVLNHILWETIFLKVLSTFQNICFYFVESFMCSGFSKTRIRIIMEMNANMWSKKSTSARISNFHRICLTHKNCTPPEKI